MGCERGATQGLGPSVRLAACPLSSRCLLLQTPSCTYNPHMAGVRTQSLAVVVLRVCLFM